jgi:hypothetical protein
VLGVLCRSVGSLVAVTSLLVVRVLCRGRSRLQRVCSSDRFVAGAAI